MSTISSRYPTSRHLARRIEHDIFRRGLAPDEKYLSTRQVQQRFGVSLTMAAQAMQLLAHEQKLVRRDRSGTYVGPGAQRGNALRVKVIYVLMPDERVAYSVVPLDLLIDALSDTSHQRGEELRGQ